jgi:RNA polymerase sigma-70 factor, ECF subfamily
MVSTEQKLWQQTQRGDSEAGSELLRMSYQRIFTYLRRLCPSDHEAADLAQETFTRAFATLSTFNGRSTLSTWLHKIAYCLYVDWRRKNSRYATKPDLWWETFTDHRPGPFDTIAEKQMASRLYELVDHLEEDRRHLVHLHYYQGLSLRDTAHILNVSPSTVKYRLREVIRMLRSQLQMNESPYEHKTQ